MHGRAAEWLLREVYESEISQSGWISFMMAIGWKDNTATGSKVAIKWVFTHRSWNCDTEGRCRRHCIHIVDACRFFGLHHFGCSLNNLSIIFSSFRIGLFSACKRDLEFAARPFQNHMLHTVQTITGMAVGWSGYMVNSVALRLCSSNEIDWLIRYFLYETRKILNGSIHLRAPCIVAPIILASCGLNYPCRPAKEINW